jgi:hypothetical protein
MTVKRDADEVAPFNLFYKEVVMPDTFTITIIFIILSTVVAAFVRRISRDKCLNDFDNNQVTLESTTGTIIGGKLNVENTGLELTYLPNNTNDKDCRETSTIFYKHEYSKLQALIRYHDELSEQARKRRDKELKNTYHPGFLRRFKRKFLNIFKTIRDSVIEVMDLFISHVKKNSSAGATLTSQGKHVSKIKQELVGVAGASFEPLLEKYIGCRVVLELVKGDKIVKCSGVLKDYTSEFVEIMDVNYSIKEDQPARKADIVVLRKYGVVRHLGE